MSNPNGSRVELAATDVVVDNASKPSRNQPDIYYGDRNKLEKWLYQLELHFKFKTVPSNEKAEYAMTFMRGRAEDWVMVKYRNFAQHKYNLEENRREREKDKTITALEKDNDLFKLFESYTTFKQELRQVFGISNDEQIAAQIIQTIRQKTSAADYTAEFQRYAGKLKWDDNALMAMYQKGLKENVKDHLAFHGGVVESLDDLIEASISIDDKLYERALEKRYRGNVPFGRTGVTSSHNASYFNNRRRPVHNVQYGDPMEIDAIQTRKPFKGRKKEDSEKSDKKCYSCGKPGHFARNCRSKNMGPSRQINMVLRRDETESQEEDCGALEEDSDGWMDLRQTFTQVRPPTPAPKRQTYEIYGQEVTQEEYEDHLYTLGEDHRVIDHTTIPHEYCTDPRCGYASHIAPTGSSQRIAMDHIYPGHSYLCASECLDITCPVVHPGTWDTDESDEEDVSPYINEYIDAMEKQLGSDPSVEKEIPDSELLTEDSDEELLKLHEQRTRCYDEACQNTKHVEWRRHNMPTPENSNSNWNGEHEERAILEYSEERFLPCVEIPAQYREAMDKQEYARRINTARRDIIRSEQTGLPVERSQQLRTILAHRYLHFLRQTDEEAASTLLKIQRTREINMIERTIPEKKHRDFRARIAVAISLIRYLQLETSNAAELNCLTQDIQQVLTMYNEQHSEALRNMDWGSSGHQRRRIHQAIRDFLDNLMDIHETGKDSTP